jgi:hypothetical protein
MASADARPIPQKNVAYRVTFPILDADGDPVTGATGLDSEISKDGGTFADCTNEAVELATSSGMYYLDLTATEMNADTVAIIVKTSTSGAKTTPIVLYPEEAGDIRVNLTQINSAALNTSAAQLGVNAVQVGGTAQTARDLGANLDTTVSSRLAASSYTAPANADITAIKAKTDSLNFTVAGEVNANMRYISGASVATGTAQIGVNLVNIAGAAVNTSSAQLGVNVVNMGGSAGTFSAGRPEVNVSHWRGTAAAAPTTAGIPRVAIEAAADFAQVAADKVWSSTTRTLSAFGFTVTVGTNNDKTGYSLSSAAIQAIWDALTSALTTAGSIGKRIVDNIDATISSRATQTSVDAVDDYVDTEVAAIKAKTDQLTFTTAGKVDANVTHVNETEVTGNGSTTPWGPI